MRLVRRELGADELAALQADVGAVDPSDLPAVRAPEGAAAEFVGCRELTAAVHPQWKPSGSWARSSAVSGT